MKKTLTLRNVIFRYALYCTIFFCSSFSLVAQCTISGPPEVCLGDSGDYILFTDLTNYTANWSVNSLGFITDETNSSASISYMSDDGDAIITVELTNEFNVVLQTCTFTTIVLPLPEPVINSQINNSCDNRSEIITRFGICEGDTVVYTANGQNNSTYEFSISGNATIITDPFTNPITVVAGLPGTALLCVIETTEDGCVSDEVCYPIDIVQKPIASFFAEGYPDGCPIDICNGQQVTFVNTSEDPDLNGNSLTNYYWNVYEAGTDLLISSSTAEDFNFTFNSPGQYYVTFQVQNECGCISEEAICEVNVEEALVHEIICPSIVCECEPATYSTPSQCSTYEWQFFVGDVLIGEATGNPVDFSWCNIPLDNDGYGSVVLTTPGCSDFCSEPSVAIVPILPNEAEIQGPTDICGNYVSTVYSVPFWPGATYNWFFNGVLQPDPGSTYNASTELFNYNGPFTITVEVDHNIVDCEFTSTLEGFRSDFRIKSVDAPHCGGDDVVLELDPGPPSSPSFTVNWNIEDVDGDPVFNTSVTDDTEVTIPSNFLIPGNSYTATVEVIIGNDIITCSVPFYFFYRDLVPVPSCVDGPEAVCVGNTYIYTICDPQLNTVYNWSVIGGIVNPMEGNSVQITFTQSDPLPVVSVTATQYQCTSNPLEFSPNILDDIDLTIIGNEMPCADGVEQYTSSELGLDNYQWVIDPPNAGSITNGENGEVATILWHFVTPNTATLSLSVDGCNITPADLPITIIPEIEVVVESPISACAGSPVTITVSDPTNGMTYDWTFGNNNDSDQTTTNSVTYTYSEAGTYFGTVSVGGLPNCPGNFEGTFTVNVQESPEPFITSPSPRPCEQDCENQDFTMTLVTEFFPGFSYQWTLNGVPIPGATSPTYTFTNDEGNYRVLVTDNNSGCSALSDIFRVSCNCEPVPECEKPLLEGVRITNIDLSSASCGTVTVTGQVFGDPNDVIGGEWVLEDPTGSNDPLVSFPPNNTNIYTIEYNFTEPGFYPVQFRIYDSNRCLYIDNAIITIPLITDFDYTIACEDNSDSFIYTFTDDTEIVPGASYQILGWTKDGVPIGGTASSFDEELTIGGTFTICLEATATVNGVTDVCEHCETIEVPDSPDANFTFDGTSTCEGQLIGFDPDASADETVSYHWDFGDNSFSMLETPFKEYATAGTYDVTLTIVTNFGCSASFTLPVTIAENNLDGSIVDLISDCTSSAELAFVPFGSATISSFEWSNGEITETIIVTESGTYDVTVTDIGGCEFSPDPINLLLDDPLGNGISGLLEYCVPSNANFWVPNNQNYTYEWIVLGTNIMGSNSFFQVGTSDPALPGELGPGTYTVQVTAFNLNGTACLVETHDFIVHPEPPQPNLQVTYTCEPFTASVTSDVDVTWSLNGSNLGFGNNILLTSGGFLRATYTDPSTGCFVFASLNIENPIDFGPFLGGCYTACDTILDGSTYCIPGIPGSFDAWRWIKLPNDILLQGSGNVSQYCPFPQDEGKIILEVDHTYNNSDGSQVVCTEASTPFCLDVEICSDSCMLDITYELVCRDRFTVDPNDDFWEIIITVNGGPVGMDTWMATSPQVGDQFGTYGEPKQIFVGEIDEVGSVELLIDDYLTKPYCPTEIIIDAPEPCSPNCFEAVVTVTDCNDNGTPDPSDDYYEVYVDMTWVSQDPLVSFTFFQNNQGFPLGSGDTDGTYYLGQFSMNDPGWFLKIHADEYFDCQIDVEIDVPEQCECTLDVTFEAKCDDRGTFDPNDDFMRVCARVDNAPSGTWYINGETYSNGETADFWVGEIDELTGPIVYEVYDVEWPNCNAEISVNIPEECSPECFIVDIKELKCNDNGTPNDPSDDTYEFCVTVIAEPGLQWQLTQNGSPFYFGEGTETYCQTFNISDGGWMFKVFFPEYDADDQDCYPGEWITPPDSCSEDPECKLEAKVLEVACDDNGTPNDPSDDTWSLVVCADGTISGEWIAGDPVNVMGIDGDCEYVDMGLISNYPNGYIEFKVYDPYFEDCVVILKVEVPKPCSEEIKCDLEVKHFDVTCHDNGTPDPSDDTWSFVLCVSGSPSGQWTATDPVNISGFNGDCITVDMGLISDYPFGVIEFRVYDTFDERCIVGYKVEVPKDCSEECGPKLEVKISECFGDSYIVSVEASDDVGCYQLVQVLQGFETPLGVLTSFNASIELGPFDKKDGCWTLKLYRCETRECEKTFLICPPDDCLVGCLNGESIKTDVSTTIGDGFSGTSTRYTNWTFDLPSGIYPCPPKTIYLNGGYVRDVKVSYAKGQFIISGEMVRGDGVLPNCFDIPLCGNDYVTHCDNLRLCTKEESTDKRNERSLNVISNDIFVYPNPIAKGLDLTVANLDWSDNIDIEVKVIDAIGKVYISDNMKTTNGSVRLSLESLNEGIYFVIVNRNGEQFTKPFTVLK